MAKNHVLKISKKGFDVKTAKDNQLLFNSDYPMLKIAKQGHGAVTCTVANPVQTVEIYHNLGYIPMYFVVAEVVDASYNLLPFTQLPYVLYLGLGQYVGIRALPDEAKITLEFDLVTGFIPGDKTLRYIYYVFEDPIIDIETYG